MANAIYFKGNWASRFKKSKTVPMPFHLSAGRTIEVPMMVQTQEFRYGETETAQILELPYVGGELAMLIILPGEIEGIRSVEQQLTADDLIAWPSNLWEALVEVNLPRFTTAVLNLGWIKAIPCILARVGQKPNVALGQ